MKKLSVIWILLSLNRIIQGAACCSSGNGVNLLITSDDRLQVQSVLTAKSLTFQSAYLISDLFQAGFSMPILYSGAAVGPGDPTLTFFYEVLPEYFYSPVRPRIFAYIGALAPFGNKSFEMLVKPNFEFTGGVFVMKEYAYFDYGMTLEVKKTLDTQYTVLTDTYLVAAEPHFNFMLNLGYRVFAPMRLGVSLGALYEGLIRKTGIINTITSSDLYYTFGVNSGFLITPEASAFLALMHRKNTTEISLAFRYHFPK